MDNILDADLEDGYGDEPVLISKQVREPIPRAKPRLEVNHDEFSCMKEKQKQARKRYKRVVAMKRKAKEAK